MEDASFIVTVTAIYVATMFSMGRPDLRTALKSRWDTRISMDFQAEDAEGDGRNQDGTSLQNCRNS